VSDFASTWGNADPDAVNESGEPPEPGLYTVAVTDAKAFTSKKNEDWVVIDLQAIGGQADEHEWPLLLGFRSQQQVNFTKRACRDLGVDVDNVTGLAELDTALKEIVGRYFDVEVKQNGDYRNTYIQGPSEGVQGDLPGDLAPTPVSAVTDDDDIPF
jgi:hypothetical protein